MFFSSPGYSSPSPVITANQHATGLTINSKQRLTIEIALKDVTAGTDTDNALFDALPLDENAFFEISPLGATNPSGHTFPTVHTYMMLSDNTVARDVFAPGDIIVTRINQVENLTQGGTDYSMEFTSCPEVSGYFDHISSLENFLLDQIGDFTQCNQYVAGTDEYRFCSQETEISITGNTLIGAAGGAEGQLSAALDFGLRDTRIDPLFYINPDRLVNPDQRYVVCPYDYFAEGVAKDVLFEKLAHARDDYPRCGGVAHDVAGTIQGRWYLAGSGNFGEEECAG